MLKKKLLNRPPRKAVSFLPLETFELVLGDTVGNLVGGLHVGRGCMGRHVGTLPATVFCDVCPGHWDCPGFELLCTFPPTALWGFAFYLLP